MPLGRAGAPPLAEGTEFVLLTKADGPLSKRIHLDDAGGLVSVP